MTHCACSLTTVTFAAGVELQRCAAHEVQTWLVNGRPAEREDVLPVLRDVFVDRRGERPTTRSRPRPAVVRLDAPPTHEPPVLRGADGDRLTALLRSRGLSGTWAVA